MVESTAASIRISKELSTCDSDDGSDASETFSVADSNRYKVSGGQIEKSEEWGIFTPLLVQATGLRP
jgi:hypothetical protein